MPGAEKEKKMSAYKDDKTSSWYAYFRYTDWTGERKQKMKRGFSTKREALEWEREFLQKAAADLSMSFESFVELYIKDMRSRIREHTWQTKENIIQKKLLPFFGRKKMNEIQTKDVIAWQNEMLGYRDAKGKGYSDTYLKTLHNQLSAILNHAVRHYDLKNNAASKVRYRVGFFISSHFRLAFSLSSKIYFMPLAYHESIIFI